MALFLCSCFQFFYETISLVLKLTNKVCRYKIHNCTRDEKKTETEKLFGGKSVQNEEKLIRKQSIGSLSPTDSKVMAKTEQLFVESSTTILKLGNETLMVEKGPSCSGKIEVEYQRTWY